MAGWLPNVLPDEDARHGSRSTYQAGCRCEWCRAGNAAYSKKLRKRKAKGQPLAGALVNAADVRLRIRQLIGEGYTRERVKELLGLKNYHATLAGREKVRASTAAKIRGLARFAMVEGEPVSESEE